MPQLLLCKRYLAGSMRGQLSLEQVRARLQLMTEFISVFEKVNPGLTKWRGKMLYQVSSVLVLLYLLTCFLYQRRTINSAKLYSSITLRFTRPGCSCAM